VQVVAAATYAWLLLHERLAPVQMLGGVVVLSAIALARGVQRTPRRSTVAQPAADGMTPLRDAAHTQRASIQSSAPRHGESR
jgi:hypothetical protein